MMLPTHALGGMLLALPVALAVPEFSGVALLAGFLGGVLPDLDMYAGHRRTLHYPVYYSALAVPAAASAGLFPSVATVAVATLLLAAAGHSVADVFGGGLELRPWEGNSRRAVYDHHRGRWIAPRRWIRYDGSPADLLLSISIAAPLLVTVDGLAVDGPYPALVGGTLAVAVVYTTLRRVLATVAERLVSLLPEWTAAYLPARYRGSGDARAASAPER